MTGGEGGEEEMIEGEYGEEENEDMDAEEGGEHEMFEGQFEQIQQAKDPQLADDFGKMSDFEDGNDSSKMDHEGGDKESQNSQSNGDKKEEPIKDIDPEV